MGKTNWTRVFLGGLLAGFVTIVLAIVVDSIYGFKLWLSVADSLGLSYQRSPGKSIIYIVLAFTGGILSVWLYSAIRPRYGAGPKTAFMVGLVYWAFGTLLPYIGFGVGGLFPFNYVLIFVSSYLVVFVLGTLAGASVYKE